MKTQITLVRKGKIKQLLGKKDSNAARNQNKNKEHRKKASHFHEMDSKEHGILYLYSPLLSADVFATHWSHACLKSFLVPGKPICTVLDSWSGNLANREQTGGLNGSHSLTRNCLGADAMSDIKSFPQRSLGNGT